jgi:hypothetical protein
VHLRLLPVDSASALKGLLLVMKQLPDVTSWTLAQSVSDSARGLELVIQLSVDAKQTPEALITTISHTVPGTILALSNADDALSTSKHAKQLRIRGPDAVVGVLAAEVRRLLAPVAMVGPSPGDIAIATLALDTHLLTARGLSARDLAPQLAFAAAGARLRLGTGQRELGAVLRFGDDRALQRDAAAVNRLQDSPAIAAALVRGADGQLFALRDVVRVESSSGPAVLRRHNRQRAELIWIAPHVGQEAAYLSNAKAKIAADLRVPADAVLEWLE